MLVTDSQRSSHSFEKLRRTHAMGQDRMPVRVSTRTHTCRSVRGGRLVQVAFCTRVRCGSLGHRSAVLCAHADADAASKMMQPSRAAMNAANACVYLPGKCSNCTASGIGATQR